MPYATEVQSISLNVALKFPSKSTSLRCWLETIHCFHYVAELQN